jgi:hypothetical protein
MYMKSGVFTRNVFEGTQLWFDGSGNICVTNSFCNISFALSQNNPSVVQSFRFLEFLWNNLTCSFIIYLNLVGILP